MQMENIDLLLGHMGEIPADDLRLPDALSGCPGLDVGDRVAFGVSADHRAGDIAEGFCLFDPEV